LAGPATPGQYAQAGAPAAPQPIGRVETAAGSATVVRNGVAVELNVGDLVFQGDVVQTLSNSALAIAFSDGSAFTLNENARMALNEFVYDPNGTANSALINLVQGTVSFIAAQVAKTGTMRVETPTAVLGIRGTFITLSVSSVDGHTVASLGLESHPVTGEQSAAGADAVCCVALGCVASAVAGCVFVAAFASASVVAVVSSGELWVVSEAALGSVDATNVEPFAGVPLWPSSSNVN
jgi:hypothetical protein